MKRLACVVCLGILLLASAGCRRAPERPMWGFTTAAIENVDLEGARYVELDELEAAIGESCQQVMWMRLDERFPKEEPSVEEFQELLGSASWIGTRCDGTCDGELCKSQVQTAMRTRMRAARSRCVCAPREEPPCAFVVDWELGDETRRQIRGFSCVAGDPADDEACNFLVAGHKKKLTLTCRLGESAGG